ncbi:hypothetical protein [uncultured Parvimonas sp.]|uniref:hypothetical protein n=1 Tax=uncultured Parvimonas sp. TaxID=747372 RepID=UPI0028D75F55|nr:hypothetical protein [uncultured Parvimonas sp.]
MLLLGVKKENDWLLAEYNLTYKVGWENICKAVSLAYEYYDNVEILVDNNKVNINSKEEILQLDEARAMTIRGVSKIIQVPLMITFFNQLQTVRVSVACATDEFKDADYNKFNMSLGQYMDSIELAMYR